MKKKNSNEDRDVLLTYLLNQPMKFFIIFRNSRSSGSRCSNTILKKSDIENITVELNQRWVQVRKYFDNFNFWEYEWNKHGTCMLEHPNLNGANKYFSQAVKWHQQYDPTNVLIACNMPPDDKKMYNNIKLTNCLKERLNITSRITLSTRNDNIVSLILLFTHHLFIKKLYLFCK